MLWKAVVAGFITAVLVSALLVVPALARDGGAKPGHGYGYWPGWGWGDDNHVHTGPPGLADKDKPGKGPHYCDEEVELIGDEAESAEEGDA